MSKIMIKIERDDISTFQMGVNVGIEISDNMSIIFTRSALEELILDYNQIIENEMKTDALKSVQCGCGNGNCNCQK